MKWLSYVLVVLTAIVALFAQLDIVARTARITGNGTWSPLQLSLIVLDGAFLIGLSKSFKKYSTFGQSVYAVTVSLLLIACSEFLTYFLSR